MIHFAAINVLDTKAQNYVKPGDQIRDRRTGEVILLTRVEMMDRGLTRRTVGGDRVQLYGTVVKQGADRRGDLRQELDRAIQGEGPEIELRGDVLMALDTQPGGSMYTLPLDNPNGTVNDFSRVG